MLLGNVPLGAGLSSSAALEMSSGLALSALYRMRVSHLDLARMGQAAEHEYVGVKCGLLDQITSLSGKAGSLVMTDFRTLRARTVPFGRSACFLVCNTRAKHALVDSAYNERRARCEEAARFFASALRHPVAALRDVSMKELGAHRARMDPVAARRAAHVIGENERVLAGRRLLALGDLRAFGQLMFESHESSIHNFENSCPELDLLVQTARKIPEVLGARLTGGGFGGSAVMLVRREDTAAVTRRVRREYTKAFGHPCDVLVIEPSDGATILSRGDSSRRIAITPHPALPRHAEAAGEGGSPKGRGRCPNQPTPESANLPDGPRLSPPGKKPHRAAGPVRGPAPTGGTGPRKSTVREFT